jgi:hypothetical protein
MAGLAPVNEIRTLVEPDGDNRFLIDHSQDQAHLIEFVPALEAGCKLYKATDEMFLLNPEPDELERLSLELSEEHQEYKVRFISSFNSDERQINYVMTVPNREDLIRPLTVGGGNEIVFVVLYPENEAGLPQT